MDCQGVLGVPNVISEYVGHGNGEKKPVRAPGDHVGLRETQLCGRVKN